MMHFEIQLTQYGLLLGSLIVGVIFWVAVITGIATIMVADRLIEELLHSGDDDEDVEQTQAYPDEDK